MMETQAAEILSRLAAGFPGLEILEDTILLWIEYLTPLVFESMNQAIQDFLLLPGRKFFPTPGEIMEFYDRRELECRKRVRQENIQAEREATQKLYQDPASSFIDDYVQKSIELIRDICDKGIRYGSPEFRERFEAIYGKGNCAP